MTSAADSNTPSNKSSHALPSDLAAIYSTKLVSSYAMDALDQERLDGGGDVDAEAVSAFLGHIVAAATETFKTVGQGTDLRLRGAGIVGAGLVIDDQVVHLSAFMELA